MAMALLACSSSDGSTNSSTTTTTTTKASTKPRTIFMSISSTSVNYYQLNDLGYSDQLCRNMPLLQKLYLYRYWLFDLKYSIFQCKQTLQALTYSPLEFFLSTLFYLHHDSPIIQTFEGLLSSLSRQFHFLIPKCVKCAVCTEKRKCQIALPQSS